jgi:hypothetical protein
MAEWQRREVREVAYVGPAAAGWAAVHRMVQQAMSEWRELSGLPPAAEVPAEAVVVHAEAGLLTVRLRVVDVDQPAGEGDRGGDVEP